MAGLTKRVVKPVTKKNSKKDLAARLGMALAKLAEVKRSHAETSRILRDERNTLRAQLAIYKERFGSLDGGQSHSMDD